MPATLAAVVFPMVTLTTAALADDDKTYPGAMCRVLTPITTLADMPALNANAAMLNNSRGEQIWICPAVRSQMTRQPEYARITVQENDTEPVDCTFEARSYLGEDSATGGKGTFREKKDLTQGKAVVYEWGAGEFDALLSPASKHGYYFFVCRVPGAIGPIGAPPNQFSGVITYKVTDDTDD
jgi:hypothetical protein